MNFRLAFIMIKVTVVSLFLLCAINHYVRKFKSCSVVVAMLSCYIVMVSHSTLLTGFKFDIIC